MLGGPERSQQPRAGRRTATCAVRAHWLIENQLHWVLDMSFGEDACTVRTRRAAHNLAVIRHFAFNLLRRGHDKHSLRMRQRRCDWDRGYRERLGRRCPARDRKCASRRVLHLALALVALWRPRGLGVDRITSLR